MGVLSDALAEANRPEADAEPEPDARTSRGVSQRDPFLMGYDTSSVKLDADSAEQIGSLVFAVSRLAGAI